MKDSYDLSILKWTVAGFNPYEWKMVKSMEIGAMATAEITAIDAPVPGSVQKALLDAGLIADWNYGLNARLCEWVENRHWVYQTRIPDEWIKSGKRFRLRCLGLDYCGCILLNSKEIFRFADSHLSYAIDLTDHLVASGNMLQIVFECPPRWLGQFGWTSKMTQWKPRFNYFWDWTSRLVQIGIWDKIFLDAVTDGEFADLKIETDADVAAGRGKLKISGEAIGSVNYRVTIRIGKGDKTIKEAQLSTTDFAKGLSWNDLDVQLWYPNGLGSQPLYTLTVKLIDISGTVHDAVERQIGFKHIDWRRCRNSAELADPWICVVNGREMFLQGANWTPIRPDFADVPQSEYRKRLELYHDLGFNIMRVWGGAFLEKEWFYDLCDELGLLVWQEFPLSSSGCGDCLPPQDDKSIEELGEIAKSYIVRRRHHVSLAIWCGGNELLECGKEQVPVTTDDKCIKHLAQIANQMDPTRRFLPSSASGPSSFGIAENYGKKIHWDVHGPWKAPADLDKDWLPYWQKDDALLRAETGSPGPCSADLTRRYKGECKEFPCSIDNPLWRRAPWWTECPEFVQEKGRQPKDLDEYVGWGQARQAKALSIAAKACKDRFPECGGIIIWMGHDCYPCPANTSIIDFEGNPKLAAIALGEIFKKPKL